VSVADDRGHDLEATPPRPAVTDIHQTSSYQDARTRAWKVIQSGNRPSILVSNRQMKQEIENRGETR
jgi:hypothetical protein